MKRLNLSLALLVLGGCSQPAPPPPPPVEQASPDATGVVQGADTLEMSGIKLYLYDKAAIPGQERNPVFSVEADKFSQDAEKTWRFTQAKAIAHAQQEGDNDIIFNAGSGALREEESASLEGGVIAQVGPMTIEMTDVLWSQGSETEPPIATTNQPVKVLDPSMHLLAEQFRLYPADSQFALLEVQGEVAFLAPQPEGEAAAAPPPPQGEVPPP